MFDHDISNYMTNDMNSSFDNESISNKRVVGVHRLVKGNEQIECSLAEACHEEHVGDEYEETGIEINFCSCTTSIGQCYAISGVFAISDYEG